MLRPSAILIALILVGSSLPVQAQRTAAQCLTEDQPAVCLRQVPANAPGLADAWLEHGLQALRSDNVPGAAEALSHAVEDHHQGYRGLALWATQYGTGALLGPARSARNRSRARALLRRDSLDVGANLLLGTQDARELARRAHRAKVPAGTNADWLTGRAAAGSRATGPGVRFSERYRGETVDISVASARPDGRLMRTTLARLRRALGSEEVGAFALRQLAQIHIGTDDWPALSEDASAFRRVRPDHALGYLTGALAADREGRAEAAATLAQVGLDLLAPGERHDLLNPARVLSTEERLPEDAESWWRDQDPIALTPDNERLTEHVVRWVYADVRFGNPYEGEPGANTNPGSVIVRYGMPVGEMQYTGGDTPAGAAGGWDRYAVFLYDGFDFRFMDLARTGEWSYYAPRSRAFEGWRGDTELRSADYVLLARQRFRDIPLLIEPSWEILPMQVSVFRASRGYDVVMAGIVPDGLGDADRAAFVLDSGSRMVSLGDPGVRPWQEGSPFVKAASVPMAAPGPLLARLEAVSPATLQGPARTVVFTDEPARAPVESFAVSSVLLADLIEEGEVAEGLWNRDGLAIFPSPDNTFEDDAPVYAYFEVYGLSPGPDGRTDYEVTATLRSEADEGRPLLARMLRRGNDSVGAGFRSSGSEASIGEYLLLERESREGGDYLLTLTITDRVAQTAVEATTRVRFN
ncbi:MAG: hypothetical protein JJ896_09455 [Rhodothermales bacterium]|nr:hypothetical protein [Rhodothermales bacterium]MBO6779864.1 hypothetical protein [Rhodothermales bacterium]